MSWVETLYTMNEERAVHEQVVAAIGLEPFGASAAPSAVDDAAGEGLDDFLL